MDLAHFLAGFGPFMRILPWIWPISGDPDLDLGYGGRGAGLVHF